MAGSEKQVKNKIYPDVKLNIVMIHGVWSKAERFFQFAKQFNNRDDLFHIDARFSVLVYGKLFVSLGRIPWIRSLISKYIAARLAANTYKYPNAKTLVIAHSFGTWAVTEAIRTLFPEFRVNYLILLGSVVKRGFRWDEYDVKVFNFIGKRDKVVLFSCLWGTGWSGRYGFKKSQTINQNVEEYVKDWGHTDYPKGIEEYVTLIKRIAGKDSLMEGV